MNIPNQTPYSIIKGDRGWEVWAVQRVLNDVADAELVEDGIYGAATKAAVRNWQLSATLGGDGIFGPGSSAKMARVLAVAAKGAEPPGLLRSVIEGESGNYIAAVNWSVPGGVDCGYTQRRVYESDYDDDGVIGRAFDSLYQVKLLAMRLRERHDAYFGDPGASTHERAWRLATLYHNYPSGADKIAAVGTGGLSSYWTSVQSWVTAIGAKFPDGEAIRTPLEWCQHYSLGNPSHNEPGMMVKYAVWP